MRLGALAKVLLLDVEEKDLRYVDMRVSPNRLSLTCCLYALPPYRYLS
jgi:hypothetical protein